MVVGIDLLSFLSDMIICSIQPVDTACTVRQAVSDDKVLLFRSTRHLENMGVFMCVNNLSIISCIEVFFLS